MVSENGWQRHVREGLEQAVDTRLVDISFYRGFKPFMQEMVPSIKDRYQQMLVAHPHGGEGLATIYKAGIAPVLVALGPEGSLYIADSGNDRIRRVDPGGVIETGEADLVLGWLADPHAWVAP